LSNMLFYLPPCGPLKIRPTGPFDQVRQREARIVAGDTPIPVNPRAVSPQLAGRTIRYFE
jgi:hypothetical protein